MTIKVADHKFNVPDSACITIFYDDVVTMAPAKAYAKLLIDDMQRPLDPR